MLRISCNGCGASAYVDCVCGNVGHDPGAAGFHHEDCGFRDLGATVTCPPGSGCCDGSTHPGLSHDQAANACPHIDQGTHGDCPEPDSCKSWYGMHDHRYEHQVNGKPPPPCPGGHCHQDLPDCTVCRTVTIEVLPGTVEVARG